MRPGVTVCIPSIPPRSSLLGRAMRSVMDQTYQGNLETIVVVDAWKEGAPRTRQKALDRVRTQWVAFLDDDDTFNQNHLESLLRHAFVEDADYVFSWFEVIGGFDPFPQHFGKVYDVNEPHHTTVTTMVRTDLAQSVGFIREGEGGEDWQFTLGCIAEGAKISHLPERTWRWYHNSGNTSGLPDRW